MIWSQAKFLSAFERACDDLAATVKAKNQDYTGDADPFHNFKACEWFSHGRITPEDGVLVRITDKVCRLFNLVVSDPAVADESFEDSCCDLAAYSILLALVRRSRTEPDETVIGQTRTESSPETSPISNMEALKRWLSLQAGVGGTARSA